MTIAASQEDVDGVALYTTRAASPGDILVSVKAIAYEIFSPRDLEARGLPAVRRCAHCGIETTDICCQQAAAASTSSLPPSLRLAAKLSPRDLEALEGHTVLHKLQRNAHSISDSELREAGIGLFERTATAANHSCVPNVWPRFVLQRGRSPRLQYIALTSISAGEELRHEYIDCAGLNRRHKLRRFYDFTCSCYRCFADGADDIPESDRRTLIDARQAAEDAIEARDFLAAAHALSTISTHTLLLAYGNYHPQIGLYHLRLAKLLLAINEPGQATPHLHRACAALRVSHGPHSALHQTARELLLSAADGAT